MNQRTDRRAFLQTTALAGAGFWVAGTGPANEKSKSANGRLRFACIGVGGKGRSDSAEAARHGDGVALCDGDEGNQHTADAGLRKAAALVRAGALGTVKEVHVWTNRPTWPQGGPRLAPADVPKGLHWDLWLGPAAERPWGTFYHPFAWRGYWDFG